MKKIFYLVISLLMINTLSAQNKKLTLYYPDSIKVVNIAGLDSMVIFICGASKVSYGGKDYNTVLIGNQCWLKENLNVGTMITGGQAQNDNGTIEKWCYNNNSANCATYGGLYQWNEAMQYVTTEGTQGICPTGWHIPTIAEFITLKTTVNSDGNALKREDQGSGAGQGTNTSGFSGLLAGGFIGYFSDLNSFGTFWSSTEDIQYFYPYVMVLRGDNNQITAGGIMGYPYYGQSIRCIKD